MPAALGLRSQDELPRPYWSNTSSNSIVRELVERADEEARGELEKLIARETIEKPVHEDISYGDVFQNQENLWNFLYFTGYLKEVSRRLDENQIYLTMAVPNEEVRYIYQNMIREWFDKALGQTLPPFIRRCVPRIQAGWRNLSMASWNAASVIMMRRKNFTL